MLLSNTQTELREKFKCKGGGGEREHRDRYYRVTMEEYGATGRIGSLACVCSLLSTCQDFWCKGVGPSTTLAWPGWKQPDVAVEVDTAQLETSRFKKCCANCVLLYFPCTEFKSAFNVYWHGEGDAGLPCTELSIWEFPFLRGVCWQGWTHR